MSRNSNTYISQDNGLLTILLMSKDVPPATYKKTVIFYVLSSLILLSIGIATFIMFSQISQIQVLYYSPNQPNKCELGEICKHEFQILEQMKAPIYILYQLEGFYQNHRRYIQSKSNYQLAGNVLSSKHEASICWPFIKNKDMQVTQSWGGSKLNPDAIASPCGAIAKTFFNDTFSLQMKNEKKTEIIVINQTGISWPGDKGHKYKRSQNSEQTQWINPEDEHFIVWMRTSGLPNFKKLWGKIQNNLVPGNYTLIANNNFNSTKWQGNRYLILTQNSPFGGKNYAIPTVLLVISIGCLFVSILFCVRWRQAKQKSY